MRSATKPNPAAVRDCLFLMIALAISVAGIAAYAVFIWIVAPPAQHEAVNDRSPDPIPSGHVGGAIPLIRESLNADSHLKEDHDNTVYWLRGSYGAGEDTTRSG
jgi:hypothetical protein